jgi:nucleotide-binding universal stress UspA family protein
VSENDFNRAPRRLLLGYDGSKGARDAVELCRAIAPADAYVAAVDVLPYPGAPSETFKLMTSADFPMPEDFFAPVTLRLPGREVATFTYVGDSPAHVFEHHAARERLDLIVVGSPHRGAIGRVVLGSVGRALLHGSPVPVATAPSGYAAPAAGGPRTIAVAYDGGEESKAALAYAGTIARSTAAALEILTVERPVNPVGGAIAYTFSLPEGTEEIQAEALRAVDPALDVRRRSLNGPTAEALAAACEEGVDLLVVGSRGYGTVDRVLLGSTSTALIHKARCPVIVVPRRAARSAGTAPDGASVPAVAAGD